MDTAAHKSPAGRKRKAEDDVEDVAKAVKVEKVEEVEEVEEDEEEKEDDDDPIEEKCSKHIKEIHWIVIHLYVRLNNPLKDELDSDFGFGIASRDHHPEYASASETVELGRNVISMLEGSAEGVEKAAATQEAVMRALDKVIVPKYVVMAGEQALEAQKEYVDKMRLWAGKIASQIKEIEKVFEEAGRGEEVAVKDPNRNRRACC